MVIKYSKAADTYWAFSGVRGVVALDNSDLDRWLLSPRGHTGHTTPLTSVRGLGTLVNFAIFPRSIQSSRQPNYIVRATGEESELWIFSVRPPRRLRTLAESLETSGQGSDSSRKSRPKPSPKITIGLVKVHSRRRPLGIISSEKTFLSKVFHADLTDVVACAAGRMIISRKLLLHEHLENLRKG